MQMRPISPSRVSPGGRHFVDPLGKPVFWLGDTQWELFRLFQPASALTILEDRKRKGFNVILIMLTGVDTERVDPSLQSRFANLEGESAWLDNDPLHPNERYFRHVDEMIRLGEQTGQTFVVGVYHQWHADVITLEKARAWTRWVSNRYRAVTNLIWSMYPRADESFRPVCQELAAGLQEGDGGAHLISVHPDPSVSSSSFLHEEPWLDFNMIQTCIDYDRIHEAVMADYQRSPVKPVVMAEGGYEGLEFQKMQTAHDIRKQAYWTQLAGGHHVYGHNDAWRFPLRFSEWLDSPGSSSLAHFREVMTTFPGWWDLIPDQSILASGPGSGYGLHTAARSGSGEWLLVYLSEPAGITVRLDALSTAARCQVSWIDPRDGSRRPLGQFASTGQQPFTTPQGWEDALLLAEAE